MIAAVVYRPSESIHYNSGYHKVSKNIVEDAMTIRKKRILNARSVRQKLLDEFELIKSFHQVKRK